MRLANATVLGLVLLLAPALKAQDAAPMPETPTFHAGQWGATFIIGNGVWGVGALHFSNPDKAWTLSGTVGYENLGEDDNAGSLSLNVGRRTFGASHGRVRPYRELGIGIGVGRNADPGSIQTALSGSVYGNLGAAIFLRPDLSIGASWEARAYYSNVSTDSEFGPDTSENSFGFTAGGVEVVGAFYF